jgi:hypothetical protein
MVQHQNQKMHVSILNYVIRTVNFLHVSANHVTILRDVHYKVCIEILQHFGNNAHIKITRFYK